MKENTGKTKYVILGLLAHNPQTGYTIKKAIEYEYRHFWQESYGQIYPTLKRLADEGLAVSSGASEESDGRAQKIFSITDAGTAELRKWLSEPPEIEKIRYELLLKVSFASNTDPEVIIGHLDDFIRRNEKMIKDLDGFGKIYQNLKNQGEDHFGSELTALCGKYIYTAMIDWAVEAKKIISNRKAEQI